MEKNTHFIQQSTWFCSWNNMLTFILHKSEGNIDN